MNNPITIQQTERGINYASGAITFHSTNDMAGMGSDQLRQTLTGLAERDAPLHHDMIPERIPSKRRELFASTTLSVVGAAIDVARRAKSDALAADAHHREPMLSVEPVLAVETRSTVRAMDAPARAAWVESADLAGLTVTAADANPASLEPAIYERARERFWIENWIARYNAEGGHPAKPSIQTVLATGPDMTSVRAEAETYYKASTERLAEIADMEAAAKSLIAFVAALFDMSAEEALDMAMGRTDAKAA